MEISHAIILNEDLSLSHRVLSFPQTDPTYEVMAGPFQFEGMPKTLIALKNKSLNLPSIGQDVHLSWHVTIADDLEKKLLLKGCTPPRSIFWLGEMLDHIHEGFKKLEFVFNGIVPCVSSGVLQVELMIPARVSSMRMIGSLLCFITLFDYVLFARGLVIKESHVMFTGPSIDIIKRIMEISYARV